MSQEQRIALIGCGAWGRNHGRVLAELGVLKGVADVDAGRARALASELDVSMLGVDEVASERAVAGVVVATPPGTHSAVARTLLEADKDVLVEKPLALTLAEARGMAALARDRDRILMVGHLMRYHPGFVALQRLVADGQVGRVQYIHATRSNLGRFRREENILWSFAPHDISMILALVGNGPSDVSATGAALLHKTIADVTITHLEFPAGEHAHVFVSWLHPIKEQRLVVVGDQAMAVFDDTLPWANKVMIYDHKVIWRGGAPEPVRAEGLAVPVEPVEPLQVECAHFLECIATRQPPMTDAKEGIRVLEVLDQAQVSLDRQLVSSRIAPATFVHESSYLDRNVVLGSRSKIWHFCHVMAGARIGRDCVLGQNVHIGPGVVIGDRVRIQNNVSVFDGVTLEDDVFCGPSCVFTNVATPRAEVDRRAEISDTIVRRGASIGANATIVCGHEIGAYALVGAGAVVTSDVPPHALVVGVPAQQVGWVSHAGEILRDDLVCPRSGRRYEIENSRLVEAP